MTTPNEPLLISERIPLKAYVVKVDDHDYEVIYAETAGKAKGRGCTEFDFTERTVNRAPDLDQYYAKGGPSQEDLFKHGWWFECDAEKEPAKGGRPSQRCYDRALLDEGGGIIGGKVVCWQHNYVPGTVRAYRIGDPWSGEYTWHSDPRAAAGQVLVRNAPGQCGITPEIIAEMESGEISAIGCVMALCANVDCEWLAQQEGAQPEAKEEGPGCTSAQGTPPTPTTSEIG
jgi:hypothetical protein